jgi:hypothetical protein
VLSNLSGTTVPKKRTRATHLLIREKQPSTLLCESVSFAMKKHLIALTFLGLVAIFIGGCTATTETTTTTERTRERSSMYAR